jgi:hypothetical protein
MHYSQNLNCSQFLRLGLALSSHQCCAGFKLKTRKMETKHQTKLDEMIRENGIKETLISLNNTLVHYQKMRIVKPCRYTVIRTISDTQQIIEKLIFSVDSLIEESGNWEV